MKRKATNQIDRSQRYRASKKGTHMTRPEVPSLTNEQAFELARNVVRSCRFPQLATCDGDQPRLRPVSPVRTDDFVVYIANLRSYQKTKEIAANPQVELCYLSDTHDQVRISGLAKIVDDQSLLKTIWAENPLLRQYLGSVDNPELIIYRIQPKRIRLMQEWALSYYEIPIPT
ncbi:MAG: pyridoxamine 5'-phosphate oxidase family protein [Pirellulaceae bacterium]|nr:pyridoxamine 5'-phosphate oxidase family protein [Pirellulaceae bacterium]